MRTQLDAVEQGSVTEPAVQSSPAQQPKERTKTEQAGKQYDAAQTLLCHMRHGSRRTCITTWTEDIFPISGQQQQPDNVTGICVAHSNRLSAVSHTFT